jgi:hypothetical protein
LFVFNPFPGFNCIVSALKSRIIAPKTRMKFLLKFVRDISTKMTLSFFRASVSVLDLSTSRSTNSEIYVLQNSPPEHIPGIKCRVTARQAFGSRACLPEPGAEILYVYDFGDYWQHDVRLEAAFPPESARRKTAAERVATPICLKSFWIRRMRSLNTCANGQALTSTRRSSPSMPQTNVSRKIGLWL